MYDKENKHLRISQSSLAKDKATESNLSSCPEDKICSLNPTTLIAFYKNNNNNNNKSMYFKEIESRISRISHLQYLGFNKHYFQCKKSQESATLFLKDKTPNRDQSQENAYVKRSRQGF